MIYCWIWKTCIGLLYIEEENEKIIKIETTKEIDKIPEDRQLKETVLIQKTCKELQAYFEGKRKIFTIPIQTKGTPFQEKVWEALRTIPYGETRSYQEIARQVGNSKAARAVGMANHVNPIMIVNPCHRVIGSNHKLIGYAGGLSIKEKLLTIEKEYK